jgi:hypothetical protein
MVAGSPSGGGGVGPVSMQMAGSAGTGGAAAGMGGGGGQSGFAGAAVLDVFESMDFKGNCWGGIPPEDGTTTMLERGKAYDIRAIGTEMGHHCPEDQGRFVYLELSGDFDITAQITMMDNFGSKDIKGGDTPAKGGLMARVSLANDSPEVAIWAAMPDPDYPDAWHFDHRSKPGGAIHMGNYAYGYINKSSPLWNRQLPNIYVRLKRTGKRFEGFGSTDGVNWTAPSGHAAYETDFPDDLYVGLSAMSSPEGSYSGVSEISFRNISGVSLP